MTTTHAGADAPRRARATWGPEHVKTGWPLVYAPRKGQPSWLDTQTGIRYAHHEIVEHPVTAALAALTPSRWDSMRAASDNGGTTGRGGTLIQTSRSTGLQALAVAGLVMFPDEKTRVGELTTLGKAVLAAIDAYETGGDIGRVLADYDRVGQVA